MKILYIYSGERRGKFKGEMGKDFPDTPFYGLNHLHKFGIEAEYREFGDIFKSAAIDRITPFSLKHFITILSSVFGKKYDVIFGSSLLYGLLLKKIFCLKVRFVLFDISLGRTLSANKQKKIKYSFIVWLLKGLDGIVCLSNFQKDNLERDMPSLTGKVFFVPLGVDTNYYRPIYEGRKNFLLSAGKDNGRDYGTIFKLARLCDNREFQILCAKRNVSNLGQIPLNIEIFFNFFDLPFSSWNAKFNEAESLLLITHDDFYEDGSDGSGQTVFLEAMACGLPVIASRKAYIKDYVIEGEDVLCANFYDEKDIRDKLEIFKDKDYRQAMAMRARDKVEKNLSTKKMAERLAIVFKNIMQIKK